jgi:ABC-type Mn2+/Zn2+ transport system ATPase subunit
VPVELTDCAFGYQPGRPVVRVDGTIRLSPGECLGVFGPNGAGKSTLVRGLLGLLPPMAGRATRDPGGRYGYLPQHRAIDFAWPMTAHDAATLAVSARRRLGWSRGAAPRVARAMERLGVAPLAGRAFATLSGGQQQRVLLAGALADDPSLLVLDEPTDGLDVASRAVLLDALGRAAAAGLAAVVVSHDAGDLLALCRAVLVVEPADEGGRPGVARTLPVQAFADRHASPGRAVS